MNSNQDQFAAVLDTTKHLNFDESTLSDLLTDDLRGALKGLILSRAWNTMLRANRDKYAMSYDLDGIRLIEDQLSTFVKPRIAAWDLEGRVPVIKRVVRSGVKTSKQEHIDAVRSDITAYGFLYGQCLAQMYNFKWCMQDNSLTLLASNGAILNPTFKLLKFVTFGQEDSLLQFARISDPRNDVIRMEVDKMVTEALKRQGSDSNGAKSEFWYDERGVLQKVVVTPQDGRVLHIKTAFVSGESGASHAN